jgi:transposase
VNEVALPDEDRAELTRWTRAPWLRPGLAQRARIVLLADEGAETNEIVTRVGVSKPTVIAWKRRYAAEGIAGLGDRPKPGRPARVDEIAVVLATLQPPPDRLGVTHWSSRLLAEQLGISNVWVARIWRKWGCNPGGGRRYRDLHRRLERTLPTIHLDQDRRRNPLQATCG